MGDEVQPKEMPDEPRGNQPFPWHLGIYDAHCHPTDIMSSIEEIPKMNARVLTIMATRLEDQDLVMKTYEQVGLSSIEECLNAVPSTCQVIPAFGWHPWFSHQLFDDCEDPAAPQPSKQAHYQKVMTPTIDDETFIRDLPPPQPLSDYLAQTKAALLKCPLAMVGEVGIDKSFRVPESSGMSSSLVEPEVGKTPGSRDGRKLSRYRVQIAHQRAILKAQLRLAGEMQRAVSVHGVAAHGLLFETIQSTWKGHNAQSASCTHLNVKDEATMSSVKDDRVSNNTGLETLKFPPRICLHSYSGSFEQSKQYLHRSVPAKVFFSFSKAINFSTPASSRAVGVIKALPADRILVESDLHRAGEEMDQMLEDMTRIICQSREWSLEDGVRQLASNWRQFAFGH